MLSEISQIKNVIYCMFCHICGILKDRNRYWHIHIHRQTHIQTDIDTSPERKGEIIRKERRDGDREKDSTGETMKIKYTTYMYEYTETKSIML